MKLYHSLLYTVCTLVLFCDGKKLESGKTSYKIDTEKAVRMLLSYKFLIVSRGVYNQPDYPRCVCSRLKTVSPVKYNHNLTYLDIYAKGQSELGKRVYRDAFYMVKKEKSTLHFSVVAYMSNHVEDEKVSGSYEVFYANKECFIAGTPLQRNPACLLWRKPHAREASRVRCRAAFKSRCYRYGVHKFVFTRDACLKKNMTKVSWPAAKDLN
uniref:Lipocalin n=1 Tax=Rhipicephalus appendiculatus TaxID=34631 RepID=A0A131YRG2_RHIAP